MRLIDADALGLRFVPKQAYLTDHILEKIETAPTVDAAPVKHGRWEPLKNLEGMFNCSLCGDEWGSAAKMVPMRYCPSCGAKMDLEEQDAKEET